MRARARTPRVAAAAPVHQIRSARHYGRHSHATFGFGVVGDGAHRSSSGRGTVDAFTGDIVTTNPGEMHDGRPLGAPSRTKAWAWPTRPRPVAVLERRWTNRQSGLSAVRDETREVLVVVEAMHAGGAADVARLLAEVEQGLREVWGVEARSRMLSSAEPAFAFP